MSNFKLGQLSKHAILIAASSLGLLACQATADEVFVYTYMGKIVRFSADHGQSQRSGVLTLEIPQANAAFTGTIRWNDTGETVPVKGKAKADGTGIFVEKNVDGTPSTGTQKQVYRVKNHVATGGALSDGDVATSFRLSYVP